MFVGDDNDMNKLFNSSFFSCVFDGVYGSAYTVKNKWYYCCFHGLLFRLIVD